MIIDLPTGFRIRRSLADNQIVLQEKDERWGFHVTIAKYGDKLLRRHLPDIAKKSFMTLEALDRAFTEPRR